MACYCCAGGGFKTRLCFCAPQPPTPPCFLFRTYFSLLSQGCWLRWWLALQISSTWSCAMLTAEARMSGGASRWWKTAGISCAATVSPAHPSSSLSCASTPLSLSSACFLFLFPRCARSFKAGLTFDRLGCCGPSLPKPAPKTYYRHNDPDSQTRFTFAVSRFTLPLPPPSFCSTPPLPLPPPVYLRAQLNWRCTWMRRTCTSSAWSSDT